MRNDLRSRSTIIVLFLVLGVMMTARTATTFAKDKEWTSGIPWPEVAAVNPGPNGGPPSDAIVLFDGKDLSRWVGGDRWRIEGGVATAAGQSIHTKQAFGDCQLHVEWATPDKAQGSGQARGNSGVYLMGLYEVQILDSYRNATYVDGQAGAIYKQHPPLVNASRQPGEWQTFDIVFEAPRFNGDKLARPAIITVIHNGVLVQNHFAIEGATSYTDPPKYTPHAAKLPLMLQFHNDPVRFRNIWIREVPPSDAPPPAKK